MSLRDSSTELTCTPSDARRKAITSGVTALSPTSRPTRKASAPRYEEGFDQLDGFGRRARRPGFKVPPQLAAHAADGGGGRGEGGGKGQVREPVGHCRLQ